jgi:hypothetical protein
MCNVLDLIPSIKGEKKESLAELRILERVLVQKYSHA